eukprot:CAMPEP_0181332700 /NCGR_PEP_ID=MMETSP1101-20121128/25254_1 /TAXON_ID=46948 /ORGANISM="Rhodomonas abbreviata, Strain Caron Lab Isolate" /LENGTH=149 /DNA_ID=CAMNT_0023442403 /DNA_START=174 /DNA_END=623 /DNA_ORIENTATION=+
MSLQFATGIEEVPDLWFSFSDEKLHSYFDHLGPDGRHAYFGLELFDLFPYMWGYKLLLGALMTRVAGAQSPLRFLPIVTFLVDVVENMCLMYLVHTWKVGGACCSEKFSQVALLASAANVCKWSSLGVVVLLLVTLFLRKRFKGAEHAD